MATSPWPVMLLCGVSSLAMAVEDDWTRREAAGHISVEDATWPVAQEVWLTGATVMPVTREPIENGTIGIRDGRIVYVGTDAPPAGARVIDATGKYITPGLIDTHSHLGVYPSPNLHAHADGNEMVAPETPAAWAEHGVWPQDPGFDRAIAGGITTLQILPGSANVIGGRGVVLRPVAMRGSRAMRFPGAPDTVKMACGENPKRVYGQRGGPYTRMGNVAHLRAAYAEAKAAMEGGDGGGRKRKGASAEGRGSDDLGLQTLIGVLRGDILLQVHCYRADDMLGYMQVGEEYGFSIRSFHHAVEAYKIRDILADKQVSVSTWSDWWGFKAEAFDAVLPNAAMVADAGGRAIIHSDSAIGVQRLNQEAAKAWQDGIDAGFEHSASEALRWVTVNPAWALGIHEETGSLDVGLRGDIVVWSSHPLSTYAVADQVFIDGHRVHDAEHPVNRSDFLRGWEVRP